MKKYILAFLCCLVFSTRIFACDCSYLGSFFKVVPYTSMTALIKVTKYTNLKDMDGRQMPLSMEVEIIEVYRGVETRKTVTVWGDPGNLCRPYISQFPVGKYFVISFTNAGKGGQELPTDYAIYNCGGFWLSADINNATATGDIDNEKGIKEMKIAELKERLAVTAIEN